MGDRNSPADPRYTGNRDQIAFGVVTQLLMNKRMRRETCTPGKKQYVVIIGSDEGGNADNAIAARPVFNHHRLMPDRR